MNQLIRCINCDEIFMKTPFDRCSEYEYDPAHPSGPVRSIRKDDFKDFLTKHRGHQLEDLKIIEDSFVSEKAYVEPIEMSYFKATNGKEKFVIKKFRVKIDEPFKYQLIPGDYSLKFIRIEIQSEEIAKQLKREFKSRPLLQTQISAFLKLYRHIAETVDIKNLDRISEESSHSLEIYCKMDDISLFYLLRNCRNIFTAEEYPDIEKFIYRHKDDGVLLLKTRYRIQVTERAKVRKKTVSGAVPAEVKKVIEKK